ncbi:TDP-N-acetylfucosamine:lipid II N-acetylfucosaminyltransferase family protein [Robertkochia flava]|uniref:TDP-N-acetylfucosamine:lipid II N-acetylfucosaminyltransferase n=1 Tax=Robertkochia flava TaxID=3447986 RepID=UPI001CCB0A43|nr:TDP-N-acetylfucosamine:lipid II N-acetylfucosaminyltransferase [Robertkochia marina]
MIVHLFEDEKFVDSTISIFEEVAPGKNKYVIFSNSEELVHVTNVQKVIIQKNNWKYLDYELIFEGCNVLLVHYLTPIKYHVIKNAPKRVRVIWSVWGRDFYLHMPYKEIYEPRTAKMIKGDFREKYRFSLLYRLYHKQKYGVEPLLFENELLHRIDYISTVIEAEYPVIKNSLNIDAEFLKFNYSAFDEGLLANKSYANGPSVFLGNSATETNNHLDTFKYLKGINRKVYIPLNYGNHEYAKKIIKASKSELGDDAIPITHFMKMGEYVEILKDCNTMIMFHIRQQALGNILLGLYLGLRIYLNKKSVTFKTLEEYGFIVNTLTDHSTLLLTPLTDEEKSINRSLVLEFWGTEYVLNGVKRIVRLNNIHDL